MATPAVTLLVPCFNAARHLPALAASIHKLGARFAEMLFYDDGSTDDTVAAARALNLPLVAGNTNRGVSYARNRLAAAASSEWIHFHDADDPLLPSFLDDLRPLLRPDVDVAVCDTDWLDAAGRRVLLSWRYPAAPLRKDPLSANLRQGIGCNTMIVRRSVFLSVGGFDETLSRWEDADLHIRLAAAGARYDATETVSALALRHPDSLSHDYRASWNARLAALERYPGRLPERVRPLLAEQAGLAAAELLRHRDRPAARRAIALCRRLGHPVPHTRNPLLRALRPFLLGEWLLMLQHRRRQR